MGYSSQERFNSHCSKIIIKADILIFVRDNEKENFLNENYDKEKPGWFQIAEENTDINKKKLFFV